jgi:glycerol-3-phosphate dehydrogenase
VAYLLAALNRAFPATGLSERDIVGVQAGIRPLIHAEGKASDASREERIHRRADGVIAIAGGKLTTYRRMAEKVAEALGFDVSLARGRPTEEIEVAPRRSDRALAERLCVAGVAEAGADRVARIYGQDAEAIATMVEGESALARPLVAGQAPIRAEVVFGARHGQARGVGDVLARRTRLILLDQCGARGAVGDVADLIARELGWSPAQRRRAVEEFLAEAEQFTVPAVQPV